MSLELFLESIRSEHTRKCYDICLRKYGYQKLSITDPKIVETQIISFICEMKKKGKQFSAIDNYIRAIVSYYKINDVILNTKKINRFMPERRRIKKDRAYTHEEISKMLEIADDRMRAVILLLTSSGVRVGALPYIKLQNLIENRLTVYETFYEEYLTFVTPECKYWIWQIVDVYRIYKKMDSGQTRWQV